MILSCDDACASDVRVADLCRKYEIPAVFYWPVEWHSLAYSKGYEPLSFTDAYNISKDFEVGSHTITHQHLTELPLEIAMAEIAESRLMLEGLFNQEITRFAPPRGYTNEDLTTFTLAHYIEQRLTKGNGLVHIHPNSGANGNKNWLECIDENTTEIWCHSWELNKYNLWEELEGYLDSYSKLRA